MSMAAPRLLSLLLAVPVVAAVPWYDDILVALTGKHARDAPQQAMNLEATVFFLLVVIIFFSVRWLCSLRRRRPDGVPAVRQHQD